MFRPRVIPVLLLKDLALVKSTNFKDYHYIGDPINAVRIFNDLRADELVFLDIEASKEKRLISLDFVRDVGEEANMPFAVGGGIKTIEAIRQVINAGAEKVVINTAAAENPEFIREAADTFGSSTIVVCIDVKKKFLKGYQTWILGGKKSTGITPIDFAKKMQDLGAGELIIQSIERDGTRLGYDVELIHSISTAVTIPVVALGGAGKISDLKDAHTKSFANGLAAGSMFVYQGSKKGVLINYPNKSELNF
ncbi:MAG: cyclase [Crocinitomicaceae bacterium]|jgi:cyclase